MGTAYRDELLRLNRELLFNFLELQDTLAERPSAYARAVENVGLIVRNMHYLLRALRFQQVPSSHTLQARLIMPLCLRVDPEHALQTVRGKCRIHCPTSLQQHVRAEAIYVCISMKGSEPSSWVVRMAGFGVTVITGSESSACLGRPEQPLSIHCVWRLPTASLRLLS